MPIARSPSSCGNSQLARVGRVQGSQGLPGRQLEQREQTIHDADWLGSSVEYSSYPGISKMVTAFEIGRDGVEGGRDGTTGTFGTLACRNADNRDLNIEFTIDVIKAAQLIPLFPNILKPSVGRLLTNVESQIQRATSHLRPIMEDQLEKEAEYGKD
ncbi:hypothetical protein H0H93_007788 [Arthromyces matolae]|nr:hypothetical protein H0H93_007788 [Arthromyces matolae]